MVLFGAIIIFCKASGNGESFWRERSIRDVSFYLLSLYYEHYILGKHGKRQHLQKLSISHTMLSLSLIITYIRIRIHICIHIYWLYCELQGKKLDCRYILFVLMFIRNLDFHALSLYVIRANGLLEMGPWRTANTFVLSTREK